MAKTKDDVRIEIACKALDAARDTANSWQSRLLVLQTLAGAIVALVKKGDSLHIIPAVVVVMFSMASLMVFMSTSHLKVAVYWEDVLDRLTGGREFAEYQHVVGRYYRGSRALLGVAPTVVITVVLAGVAGYESLYLVADPVEKWTALALLGLSLVVLALNLIASANAELGSVHAHAKAAVDIAPPSESG